MPLVAGSIPECALALQAFGAQGGISIDAPCPGSGDTSSPEGGILPFALLEASMDIGACHEHGRADHPPRRWSECRGERTTCGYAERENNPLRKKGPVWAIIQNPERYSSRPAESNLG